MAHELLINVGTMDKSQIIFLIEECLPPDVDRRKIAEAIVSKLKEQQIFLLTKKGIAELEVTMTRIASSCAEHYQDLFKISVLEDIGEIEFKDYLI